MITAQDLEYHTPPDAGHTWAETYFFPIALPEEHLLVTVYVVVRPGLGVMVNDVAVYGALSDTVPTCCISTCSRTCRHPSAGRTSIHRPA